MPLNTSFCLSDLVSSYIIIFYVSHETDAPNALSHSHNFLLVYFFIGKFCFALTERVFFILLCLLSVNVSYKYFVDSWLSLE